ncbi:SIR2 family protein [Bradyrhizobium sp. SZCCHNR1020]|uniref:SIR2 family protein n=1 Tax=Bradyrhizobium sp. SZCCHNR1020 TaxID=3057343 RepID=UPI002916C957|nr:SIR2 family protein [Bradyrhizobium sp. SZCCHNR1020]
MWFLGAGASRAAGIKTAGDMIWDFKQRLYRSQKKLPPSAITDIGEPAVRRKLQAHFDAMGGFPAAGTETEYSAYFEATYHSPKDRRAYLDELITRGKPSFGHHALALLMAHDLCRIVWTTNFDRTVEDAAAEHLGGTGRLVVADLKEPEKIRRALDENRWPVYGKLHGDYHSDSLKNTDAELRQQDAEMRRSLVDASRRQGLAVIGYSGRDASVMDALNEALDEGRGYPGGLFWFKRGQDTPYPAVTELIARARTLGIDAHLVEAESFDELFSDLLRFLPHTADKLASLTATARPRLATANLRPSTAAVPAIRMNALAVTSRPALCRIVDCEIGGDKEIEEAIATAGVDIIAHRIRDGVLAFGRDNDIRGAFEPFGIKAFDHHPLSSKRLVKEGGERALVRDALFRAIAGRPCLALERRGNRVRLRPEPGEVQPSIFNTTTAKSVDVISGTVPKTDVVWSEACGLRVDYRLERLWLLIEPIVITELTVDASDDTIELVREFVRERRARRHNRLANALLDGWISLIVGREPSVRLKAFGIADGIDAEFEILRVSAFSGPGKR